MESCAGVRCVGASEVLYCALCDTNSAGTISTYIPTVMATRGVRFGGPASPKPGGGGRRLMIGRDLNFCICGQRTSRVTLRLLMSRH